VGNVFVLAKQHPIVLQDGGVPKDTNGILAMETFSKANGVRIAQEERQKHQKIIIL
jgi:hypothetical protein